MTIGPKHFPRTGDQMGGFLRWIRLKGKLSVAARKQRWDDMVHPHTYRNCNFRGKTKKVR